MIRRIAVLAAALAALSGGVAQAGIFHTGWYPKADTRPAPNDRASAIRDAQHTSGEITIPPMNPAAPASFPSIDGNTMSGVAALRASDAEADKPPAASKPVSGHPS